MPKASPSSRRAWIEIFYMGPVHVRYCVALLAEGVDRNLLKENTRTLVAKVALLAEGVDRNGLKMSGPW